MLRAAIIIQMMIATVICARYAWILITREEVARRTGGWIRISRRERPVAFWGYLFLSLLWVFLGIFVVLAILVPNHFGMKLAI